MRHYIISLPNFKFLFPMHLNKWIKEVNKITSSKVYIVEIAKLDLLNLLGKVGRPFKGNLPTPEPKLY